MVLRTPHDTNSATAAWTVRHAVRERRSIRHFRPELIPEPVIRDLLNDTVWAPSPHNSQPWRFTVLLSASARTSLADAMARRLVEDLRSEGTGIKDACRQANHSRQRIANAPVAVLCSLHRDGLVCYPDERMNRLEWDMAVQSVGAALQTLFLLAWERNIGSCWMAAPMYCPDAVREALYLPEDTFPQALVLLGYAALPGKLRDRRQQGEIVEVR